ncbi:MAG: NAD(P)-binding protein [Pseudomonadota bacterium]
MSRARLAIIGAGLSGLVLARALREFADVAVFEKSRGFGGRMSTRRADPFAFDHGTQYFTAQTPRFRAFLEPYLEANTITCWMARHVQVDASSGDSVVLPARPLYVGVPAMNAFGKALAEGLAVWRSARVIRPVRAGTMWKLEMEDGTFHDGFDWVISTAPAEQTAALLPEDFAEHEALTQARMAGCYTLMLGLEAALELPWDAARVGGGPLGWIALNNSKPGRPEASSLVVQSSNEWAEAHMEDDQTQVANRMLEAAEAITGRTLLPAYRSLHRWRYAAVKTPAAAPFLVDAPQRLAAAGDWCLRARVEAAYESAIALAIDLKDRL